MHGRMDEGVWMHLPKRLGGTVYVGFILAFGVTQEAPV